MSIDGFNKLHFRRNPLLVKTLIHFYLFKYNRAFKNSDLLKMMTINLLEFEHIHDLVSLHYKVMNHYNNQNILGNNKYMKKILLGLVESRNGLTKEEFMELAGMDYDNMEAKESMRNFLSLFGFFLSNYEGIYFIKWDSVKRAVKMLFSGEAKISPEVKTEMKDL